jgi:hypothetical protein
VSTWRPPSGGAGHFNVLRGHLGPEHVSGVKVVGDFVGNWRLGLPSELALVLLLDPDTGMPPGIVDATLLTARAGHHRPGRRPAGPPPGRRGRPRHRAALPLTRRFRLAGFAPSGA